MIRTGLQNLVDTPPESVAGQRLGLLCNQASVDHRYRHSRMLINERFPGKLTVLFSPQHGFFGEKQDNMIESDHLMDPVLGIPVFSLYGKERSPNRTMLDHMDTLIVDIQDAGTRVYTFIYTMSLCMEAAKRQKKRVVVLDRPNPINGTMTEGNCLLADCTSFVGRYPIPMRHGMTIGELATLFNEAFDIGCDLEVIPMTGWRRSMYFSDTGLPWVAPSPNLPTPVSAMVYPGQVIWEGTNVSEGRGTTQPFELFGAPWVDSRQLLSILDRRCMDGVILRQAAFEPTSSKWQGRLCSGFQLHITDRDAYRPYITTLALIQAMLKQHQDRFEWKQPPYEYEHHRLPIDLIIGDKILRQRLENSDGPSDMAESWREDLKKFEDLRRRYFLYD